MLVVHGAAQAQQATTPTTSLNDVIAVSDKKLKVAQASQSKIDELADERRSLYDQYKAVLKEIEGLQVYNKQLNKQILTQRTNMERMRKTIEDVAVMQRQVTPLMIRMIEGLKQFIALDVPFLKVEREARIARLESMIDDPNISVSEKFRAVMQAYQIENDYGRDIETYTETLTIDEEQRQVDILRVGRVALVYQTKDGKYSGHWDMAASQWVELGGGSDRSNIAKGLSIAAKQSAPDLIILPVEAPEVAQ
jgi:uncharacterized phage infection (PIP) family protein YhgE